MSKIIDVNVQGLNSSFIYYPPNFIGMHCNIYQHVTSTFHHTIPTYKNNSITIHTCYCAAIPLNPKRIEFSSSITNQIEQSGHQSSYYVRCLNQSISYLDIKVSFNGYTTLQVSFVSLFLTQITDKVGVNKYDLNHGYTTLQVTQ